MQDQKENFSIINAIAEEERPCCVHEFQNDFEPHLKF